MVDFAERFGGAYDPTVVATFIRDPEMFAAYNISKGLPPPTVEEITSAYMPRDNPLDGGLLGGPAPLQRGAGQPPASFGDAWEAAKLNYGGMLPSVSPSEGSMISPDSPMGKFRSAMDSMKEKGVSGIIPDVWSEAGSVAPKIGQYIPDWLRSAVGGVAGKAQRAQEVMNTATPRPPGATAGALAPASTATATPTSAAIPADELPPGEPYDVRSPEQKGEKRPADPNTFGKALAALRAPAAPEAPKVSTPGIPRAAAIPPSGLLQQLMLALSAGAQPQKTLGDLLPPRRV